MSQISNRMNSLGVNIPTSPVKRAVSSLKGIKKEKRSVTEYKSPTLNLKLRQLD